MTWWADPRPIVIAALSGRALAAAARRAGARAIVLDLFADCDTGAYAGRCLKLPAGPAGFDPEALLDAVDALTPEARGFVYGAGFEQEPCLLAAIAARLPVLGNAAATVAAVKDPFGFAALLARLGLPHPETSHTPPADGRGWLRKRAGGAGGSHVVPVAGVRDHPHQVKSPSWSGRPKGGSRPSTGCRAQSQGVDARDTPGSKPGGAHDGGGRPTSVPLVADIYYQRQVPGRPVSALFVADGRDARVLGLSDQWAAAGEQAPFRFGGCAGPVLLSPRLSAAIAEACSAITATVRLVGLNSLDLLVDEERFHILEINPRPGATLDLFDGREGLSLWRRHLDGVAGKLPPSGDAMRDAARAAVVLYAPRVITIPADMAWPRWIADRGAPGTRIGRDEPVCTVRAAAATAEAARQAVERRAAALLARLTDDVTAQS